MIGPLLRVLVVALLLLVGAVVWINRTELRPPETATMVSPPRPLAQTMLTDAHGEAVSTESAFSGHYTLLFFGYTHCPDICPLTLATLAGTLGKLDESDRPEVWFVSVDPRRDTPATIERYLATFDPAFHGASAQLAALEPLLKQLGVTVHVEQGAGEDYTITHNAVIYVVDPEGELLAVFSPPHAAEAIARDVERIRRLHSRPQAANTSS